MRAAAATGYADGGGELDRPKVVRISKQVLTYFRRPPRTVLQPASPPSLPLQALTVWRLFCLPNAANVKRAHRRRADSLPHLERELQLDPKTKMGLSIAAATSH